jgi:hypothetical protein
LINQKTLGTKASNDARECRNGKKGNQVLCLRHKSPEKALIETSMTLSSWQIRKFKWKPSSIPRIPLPCRIQSTVKSRASDVEAL